MFSFCCVRVWEVSSKKDSILVYNSPKRLFGRIQKEFKKVGKGNSVIEIMYKMLTLSRFSSTVGNTVETVFSISTPPTCDQHLLFPSSLFKCLITKLDKRFKINTKGKNNREAGKFVRDQYVPF